MNSLRDQRVVVVGLGYVGLPLAVALAPHFQVIGLDIDEQRVAELRRGLDRTDEVDSAVLAETSFVLTSRAADAAGADVYIITVPTPVDAENRPDLRPVIGASHSVGKLLDGSRRPIIVF